ncbi:MAG TPA: hypothetical protein VJT15_14715 [Pyrinomonadaceae bacterium]|nr:hypothetical protein [Pyrinomonadaceae bacterium]
MKQSALWVTNLGAGDAQLTVEVDDSAAAASAVIPAATTLRLDESLPAGIRKSNKLLIRSNEDVATVIAPADFAIDASEFFSARAQQQDGPPQQSTPKWVRELSGIGISGANVFKANRRGYAPAVGVEPGVGKQYVFGAGVALNRPNSSVELTLVSKEGKPIKSLIVSSSKRVHWQGELGEFKSGSAEFPSRIEMTVLSGTAQGFMSLKDSEQTDPTMLPIAPLAEKEDGGGFKTFTLNPGGYAYYSNGIYDSRFTSYTYHVYGAPPNMCGTLNIVRNGVSQSTAGWICTNGNGQATRGPWTGSTNQTGQNINIQWTNGTSTVGGDHKVDDAIDPEIWSVQTPGVGVPIPNSFHGSGSDTQWGTGFNFLSWSHLYATFREIKPNGTSKYWDGSGYNSSTLNKRPCNSSPPAGGFNINWACAPPPLSAHNSTDTYEWCVFSRDYFYDCFNCLYFIGPR